MGRTGMTRRIDELGRLVIPKEIRRSLKIKDNDQVEINIIDDKIVLSKYENLVKDHVISLLINLLKRSIKKNILFTSRNSVIDSSMIDKDIIQKELLNEDIMNIIENRKEVLNFSYQNFLYNIFPLVINGDLYGSIIIFGNETINNNELEIIKFSKLFLENYLE